MKRICDIALEKGYAMSVEIETGYDKTFATFETEGTEIEIAKFKDGHYVYYEPQLVSFAPTIEKLFESETELLQYLGWEENDMKETYYIVEVNDEIYLNLNFGVFENNYYFTKDFREAHKFEDFDKSVEFAEHCGGVVKKYRVIHELLDCDEVLL